MRPDYITGNKLRLGMRLKEQSREEPRIPLVYVVLGMPPGKGAEIRYAGKDAHGKPKWTVTISGSNEPVQTLNDRESPAAALLALRAWLRRLGRQPL